MSKDACVQAEVIQNASIFIGTEQQNQQVLWDILDPNFKEDYYFICFFSLSLWTNNSQSSNNYSDR